MATKRLIGRPGAVAVGGTGDRTLMDRGKTSERCPIGEGPVRTATRGELKDS